jgi:gentisate 1,2-dioxygenase
MNVGEGESPSIGLEEIATAHNLVPLWGIYHEVMASEPPPACAASLWKYSEIRPLLVRAGGQVSVADAERRVLLLRNPALDAPFATHTLGCGFQLLLPGEIEGSHRHTPTALRLVVESSRAYTTTDGERIWMHPGDVISTPSWTWHDHGASGDAETIWLDGIDVPLINSLHLNFTEYMGGGRQQPLNVSDGNSHWRFGNGLLPDIRPERAHRHSPIYSFPYQRTRPALEHMAHSERPDSWNGTRLWFSNPYDGGHFTPTLAAAMHLLPAGFETLPYRSTDAAIFHVVEGRGQVEIETNTFAFEQGDTFVVPNWTDRRMSASTDCVLFTFSDRAMQERLYLWRERRS